MDTLIAQVQSTCGETIQRWLAVFSRQACHKQLKTFEKNLAKMHERNAIDLKHLKNQPFSCETDAIRAAERFLKKLHYQTLSCRIVRKDVYKQKGRPSRNQSPQEQEWHIVGELHSDDEAVTRAKQGRGMFVVATSELDQEILKR